MKKAHSYRLTTTVTFKVTPLCSDALFYRSMQLTGMFLEVVFCNVSFLFFFFLATRWMFGISSNLVTFQAFFNFINRNKKPTGYKVRTIRWMVKFKWIDGPRRRKHFKPL